MASVVSWWERIKGGDKPQGGGDFFPDMSELRVSEHAVKRYWERVPESNDLDDAQVHAVLRERLAKAAFVYDGILQPQSERSLYFIDEGLVLIVVPNAGDEPAALVTLYPVDYGFSTDIDAYISKNLLKGVVKLHQQIKKGNEEVRKTMSAVDGEGSVIDDRLAVLRAEIELLEERKRGLMQTKSETTKHLSLLNFQLQEEASKLVISKRYSVEVALTAQKAQATQKKR